MQRILIGFSLFMLTAFGSLSAQTATDQQQSTATAGGSYSGISDSEFARKAAEGSMAEVELGQLASQKAQSPEVKQFAQRMVTDHTQANDQLKQAVQGQNLTLPTTMGSDDQQLKDRLSNLSGSDFDRAYMQAMVQDHQEDLSLFRQEASNGQGALKSFAAGMVPKLEDHYRMAQDIASRVGASASTGDQSGSSSSSPATDLARTDTGSSTEPSSSTSATGSVPYSSSNDTARPMVNNRTSEHGSEQSSSSSSSTSTAPSDTTSTSSSTSPYDNSNMNSTSSSAQTGTEPSTQSSTTSSSDTSSATSSSSSNTTDNTTSNTNTTQGNLPRTASPLPLIGFLGLMSLGMGLFLNLRRRLN